MSETADIGKQQIAAVYAKALISASEKTGKTDEVLSEFDSLVDDVLVAFPGFEGTLSSPRLSPDEKLALIDRVFGGRASEEMKTFLKVLCQHGRLDCLSEIRNQAHKIRNGLRNRVAVQVTTAHPLSDQQREQIVHELQVKMSCEVDLAQEVDEEIIGGLVVRVGDTVVDGSVRNRLAQMQVKAVQRVVEQIHGDNEKFAPSN